MRIETTQRMNQRGRNQRGPNRHGRALVLLPALAVVLAGGLFVQPETAFAQLRNSEPGVNSASSRQISIAGQVVLADGSPPPQPVQIEKICGGRRQIEKNTNQEGKFYFTIGRDPTTSMSNARSRGPGDRVDELGRTETAGIFAATGRTNMDSQGHVDLSSCEVTAVLSGYRSSSIQLGRRSVFESPDVGTIVLTPLRADGSDPTVSATTLNAPKLARKAFQKARKELAKAKPNLGKAQKELDKAVQLHPKFAEAWYELGELQLKQKEVDQAIASFEKAVAADSKYVKPYPPLALVALSKGDMQEAARLADLAVKSDPGMTEAHYYRALAHYQLGENELALESAEAVQKQGAGARYPRVCIILGDIYARRGDPLETSALQYRRYLELEPRSKMASGVLARLQQWETEGLIESAPPPAPAPDLAK